MRRLYWLASFILLISSVVAEPAVAQLQNTPFSFGPGPGGSVGMSVGGRQAIINEKLFGSTPSVILRDPSGQILDLREGPNDTAVVSVPGGNVIPGYRGRDFRDGEPSIGVGIVNAFVLPRRDRIGGAYAVQADSADLVNTWTLRVLSGGGAAVGSASSVDLWTAMVFGLGRLH